MSKPAMSKSSGPSRARSGAPRRSWWGWGGGFRFAAACGLVGALSGGCNLLMQKPHCPALDSCGGPPPIGTWVLAPGHGSCTEDIYVAPTDTRLTMGTVSAARTAPPEPALYDWCDQLVTSAGNNIQAHPAAFYTDDVQVGAASITYDPMQGTMATYSAGITKTGRYELYFPALCMREFGATDGKPAIDPNTNMATGGPVDVCAQLQPQLRASGIGEGSFRNTTCVPADDQGDHNGCSCVFDVEETGGGAGTWLSLDDNTVLNLPGTNFPQKVTYCNTGNELQLTGADGEDLYGTLGLRTLDLIPMPATQ